jgi:transcriptional antiterminator RfaH
MKRWYVAYTAPTAELRAVGHLRRQGFEVYSPLCRQIRRHARREETVLRPLFPRYVFVALDLEVDRWRSVNGTMGVSNLVCRGDRPAALPDGVVEALRISEIEEGAVALSKLVLFDAGARLRVLDGAFAGQTGIFHSMTAAERVVLLFDLIGREVRVTVPIHAVEAA